MNKTSIDIQRSRERFHTEVGWLDSWHNFSFGEHYDPENTHHGLLIVNNDDIVKPASGFGMHPHRDMEIVTWVLDGELQHSDSQGNEGKIYPGLAQRMSAGSGIIHSEINPRTDKEVHLVQMWVLPDKMGIPPGYEQKDINQEMEKGGLVPIASGKGHPGAVAIHQKSAVLWGGRLKPSEKVKVPDSPFVHVFIAKGTATLEGSVELQTGDSARLTSAGPLELEAGGKGAEVLIWETQP